MKLVSDLKQFLILNDFPSVNEAIDERSQQLRALQEECDRKLIALRDEVSTDLYELEEEYYSSRYTNRAGPRAERTCGPGPGQQGWPSPTWQPEGPVFPNPSRSWRQSPLPGFQRRPHGQSV